MTENWISTGKAAKILGYCPDHFLRKFEEVLPNLRLPGGHHRWLESAILDLKITAILDNSDKSD